MRKSTSKKKLINVNSQETFMSLNRQVSSMNLSNGMSRLESFEIISLFSKEKTKKMKKDKGGKNSNKNSITTRKRL